MAYDLLHIVGAYGQFADFRRPDAQASEVSDFGGFGIEQGPHGKHEVFDACLERGIVAKPAIHPQVFVQTAELSHPYARVHVERVDQKMNLPFCHFKLKHQSPSFSMNTTNYY